MISLRHTVIIVECGGCGVCPVVLPAGNIHFFFNKFALRMRKEDTDSTYLYGVYYCTIIPTTSRVTCKLQSTVLYTATMTTTVLPSGYKQQAEFGKTRDREQIPAIHPSGPADIGTCRADPFWLLPLFFTTRVFVG